jgi:hypothetical protein
MIGSSTPLAEAPNWHPVHRANALLRAAMLNSTASPLGFESWDDEAPFLPFGETALLVEEPIAIADPEPPAPIADAAMPALKPQIHVQALVDDFYRRQRQVSLLVAFCLAGAAVLTLVGLMILASLSLSWTPEAPLPAAPVKAPGKDDAAPPHPTSIAWQQPSAQALAAFQRVSIGANRTAKTEKLKVLALDAADAAPPRDVSGTPQLILATPGRPLQLGPLLPRRQARYLMLRGLRDEATLSAGRRSASGAWMVKDKEAQDLTLHIGNAASGDYPVEVYLLDAAGGPQARRKSRAPRRDVTAHLRRGLRRKLGHSLLDKALGSRAAETEVAPPQAAILLKRAEELFGEGAIAAARPLLLHLAERGEGDAVYELARTFDQEMMAELGARDMDGDLARAHRWYERAQAKGHAKAAARLKILASLSGRTPSD